MRWPRCVAAGDAVRRWRPLDDRDRVVDDGGGDRLDAELRAERRRPGPCGRGRGHRRLRCPPGRQQRRPEGERLAGRGAQQVAVADEDRRDRVAGGDAQVELGGDLAEREPALRLLRQQADDGDDALGRRRRAARLGRHQPRPYSACMSTTLRSGRPARKLLEVVAEQVPDTLHVALHRGRRVRGDRQVRRVPQRVVGARRLVLGDVDRRPAQVAGLQGGDECRLVDRRAAADVDEARIRPASRRRTRRRTGRRWPGCPERRRRRRRSPRRAPADGRAWRAQRDRAAAARRRRAGGGCR